MPFTYTNYGSERRNLSRCLVLLVALAACSDSLAPTGAEPITPPAEASLWWNQTEGCSGRYGDFARLAWYSVPDGSIGLGRMVRWSPPHTIYVVEQLVQYPDPATYRRAMLTDLLGGSDALAPEWSWCSPSILTTSARAVVSP